ncbi:MAG: GNAT family N-acetyltransferase [Phycisphaerales bacterium]|nr:GNAT family N-acetyltransferase [Phycisphaerales bacterium]
MPISIIPVKPDHIPALGEICHLAFSALQDRHGVERDFDTVEIGQMVISLFATRPDIAGFAAIDTDTGKLLGSNFLAYSDPVAGVGPITIHPDEQSRGIGRLLMLAVMEEAERRGIAHVRLFQETINTCSLSLYTKLGFDWRDAASLIRINPAPKDDPRIRPLTTADLPLVDEISKRHYHSTRIKEVADMLRLGFPGFVLADRHLITGYFFPGLLGHGFAVTDEGLASLVTHSARHAPPQFHKAILPLSENNLHRELMARGCRSIKMFNYMTLGPWQPPAGAWMPCIGM